MSLSLRQVNIWGCVLRARLAVPAQWRRTWPVWAPKKQRDWSERPAGRCRLSSMVSTGALTVSTMYVCVCLCARHSLLAELDSKASEVSPEQCDISVLCIFLFVTSSARAHRSILQLERVGVCVTVQKCACVSQGDPWLGAIMRAESGRNNETR